MSGMRTWEVAFEVPFLQAKQRPRITAHHGAYTPRETKAAERAIAIAYKGACIRAYGEVVRARKGVPVAISVECRTAAPKQYPRWLPAWLKPRMPFTKKPDWDNLGKTVTDALNGIAYADDSQVIAAHIYKLDMEPGQGDAMRITVQFALPDQDEGGEVD